MSIRQFAPAADTLDTRLMLNALQAFKRGDFSARLPSDWTGLSGKIADAFNEVIEMNERLADELERVSHVVGKEGKLSQRAAVGNPGGAWSQQVDSINTLIDDLARPTTEMARVIGAVAKGDLSQTMSLEVDGRPLQGQFLRGAKTVNTMVDQLNSFSSEVTRVAREVGIEGKLGGQAKVKGVAGTWKDLTDNVNLMANNLTGQVRNIADVTTAVANGDLSKKITVDVKGEILELKNTINIMVDQLNAFASEVTRVAREVGTEGKLGGQASVPGVAGTWKDLTDNVNMMANNLTGQVRNISEVTTAVATGDLSKKITVDVRGEILGLKDTINTMVDQLRSFASEVTRVAREVGTEGSLGGQAQVKGVSGTWKDLTDNVNLMAANLTSQVRGIAKVVTGVANGDLRQKLSVDAKGEIAALTDTINSMIDTLATFAQQVTTVAREVGVEGKLGGQASVPGAAGTWKDLTDNVNQLSATLTTQVRAIADVATAVTKGDLTRSIRVEASGEVAVLKDNINEMIRNLRDTTQKNSEQDWLKTNLARFTRMLQGQKDLLTVSQLILSELAPLVEAQHGVFYVIDSAHEEPRLRMMASYAYRERHGLSNSFRLGEGLVGQCALEKQAILLHDVPGNYIQISSGLGAAPPLNIIVLPVLFEGQIKAVIELASFQRFGPTHETFLDQLTESIGIVLNTIEANMRTEELLKQSQSLAGELQERQEELQHTNSELEEKARLLAEQNREVERKNREVGQAKQELEEKAAQLALTSKYKSEFLANMSHELRTPLNSLLILAQQFIENPDGNLTGKQIEFANTIYSSGSDLLTLINDILDLAKIESGTVSVDVDELFFGELRDSVERTFRPVAEAKGLDFTIELSRSLPKAMHTDIVRLQQVLKNLLSNAFKFTPSGKVSLRITQPSAGWSADHETLNRARSVIAFSVSDTGIGIASDKQKLIFEAFQQADGTTSRKYGGTGLGLSISREIASLLGGEIRLESVAGEGSEFTLYLPQPPVYTSLDLRRETGGREGARSLLNEALSSGVSPTRALPGAGDEVSDDREDIAPGERVMLIIENDANFARVLLQKARDKDYKGVIALRGAAALGLARQYKPSAITLDLLLGDVDGWTVLDLLKSDPELRHIPVHIISVQEERERGRRGGALSFLTKPVSNDELNTTLNDAERFVSCPIKTLLIVAGDEQQRSHFVDLVKGDGIQCTAVGNAHEAHAALGARPFDCMVVDLDLSDMGGAQFIGELSKRRVLRDLPIIVYTEKELTRREETALKRAAKTMIIKSASSPERMLDEIALFLHRTTASLSESQRQIVKQLHPIDAELAGRRVLVVDDDVRNLFAITSLLERHRVEVLHAENGKDAIAVLEKMPNVDVVLMDIMMPEMDGYDTMRAIRKNRLFQSLPIIALTAKAMKGDREKCIDAGASDYIPKPVASDQLLSLLQVWLHQQGGKLDGARPAL